MPLVSVIIVTCNRPQWLREAVASVVAQALDDWDCMIIDNGDSETGYAYECTNVYRYLPASHFNLTIGAARNFGAKGSDSDYLLFLDDDDILKPDALANLLRPIENRPHLAGSYGYPYLMTGDGKPINEGAPVGKRPHGGLLRLADMAGDANMVTPPGCALIRRSAFEACGGWDESGTVRESVELFYRLLKIGPMAVVPQTVIGYRQHAGQLSRTRNADHAQMERTHARLQECLQEVYG